MFRGKAERRHPRESGALQVRRNDVSLTDLLAHPATRDQARACLDELLPEYGRTVGVEPRIPCGCGHPQLVGTAFDYAARLELGHLAHHAITAPWVAEHAVALLRPASPACKRAARVVREARNAAEGGWPRSAKRRHRLIAAHAARLAQLDPVFRAAYPPTFGEADEIAEAAIAREVVGLLEIAAPLWELSGSQPLLLNPTFGRMSQAVGGADADLIAGDVLVEIKTTRHARMERDHVRQLIGYVALARACGRGGRLPRLRAVAVYFSRFGTLQRLDLLPHVPDDRYVALGARLAEIWRGRRAA